MTTAEAKAERKKKKKASTALAMESPPPSPVIMICGETYNFSTKQIRINYFFQKFQEKG